MHLYLIVRVIAACAIVTLAVSAPNLGASVLGAAETRLYRFARHRWWTIVAAGAFAIVANAAIALATRIPQPYVNDEYGHLLAADTFASGRLSNPTHPMWRHFAPGQVIWEPTYASKYPPGQGLMLAVGQIVGQPILGVWLSAGLACAAICWMLQGWFRPGLALVGTLLALYRIGVTTYWSQSYWGGLVAALGGALVFGALKRSLARPRVGTSITLGVGLAILANSRPYEGLLVSIPVFAVLAWECFRTRNAERALFLRRVFAPVCTVGALALLWMGYYNFRQTGDALLTAYQVYTDTYEVQPIFAWEKIRQPPLSQESHAQLAKTVAEREHVVQVAAPRFRDHLFDFWAFYCGVAFSVPLLLAILGMRSLLWCALASVAAVMLGLMAGSIWIFPHYAAPMTGPFFILVTCGWSRLRACRVRHRRVGLLLARTTVMFCVAILLIRILAEWTGINQIRRHSSATALLTYALQASPPSLEWPFERAAIEKELERSGGKHLILVRYAQDHDPHREWVYNKADIDNSAVVWAHDMGPVQNRKLIDYFRSRHVWLLETDRPAPKLVPYPALLSDVAARSPGGPIDEPAHFSYHSRVQRSLYSPSPPRRA